MPRTQGEVTPASWVDLFQFCSKDHRCVFVDVGSGYGTLVRESVKSYGCIYGIGIEKYRWVSALLCGFFHDSSLHACMHVTLFWDRREPAIICSERQAAASQAVRDKTRFILSDINDVDLLDLLSDIDYEVLVIFCNNLVFNPGTNTRCVSPTTVSFSQGTGAHHKLIRLVPPYRLQSNVGNKGLIGCVSMQIVPHVERRISRIASQVSLCHHGSASSRLSAVGNAFCPPEYDLE